MYPAEIAHDRAANHDVVKVGDDEIGVMDVDIHAETGKEEARQAADGEQADEAERIQHRRIVGNRAFVERRDPVKDFYGRGDRHKETQQRESQRGVSGLAGDKHVMRPNEKTDDGNGQAGSGDEVVAEDRFARKRRNHLADHAHRRQDHDVHRRMRIEPEQVLEEHRVAAHLRVEEADVEDAFQPDKKERDGDDGRAENENDARRVVGPDKKRQTEPGHAWRAHRVNGHDEVQARQNRRETVDENAEDRGRDRRIGVDAAVRRVEGPAGVQASGQHGIDEECPTDDIEVPAQQVDLREGEVFRADHQRDQEISEDRRNRRNQEEENHRHAVHGEELVVSFRRDEVTLRRQQVDPDHDGEGAANEKKQGDGREIKQGDPLMVRRKQPRADPVRLIQIVGARQTCRRRGCCRTHRVISSPRSARGAAEPAAPAGT